MKTKYFSHCKSLDDVKRLYKKLALEYHPDRPGGNVAIMQKINQEYDEVMKDPYFEFSSQTDEAKKDYVEYPEIISKIISFDITIEICGNWIWLSGNTRKYSRQLKETGFFYAPKKKMWYWRPNDFKSTSKKPISIDEIRSKYGSDVVEADQESMLSR